MYKLDELSLLFGKLEWDVYLISRGVRVLGDHHFKIEDFNKVKSQIEDLVKAEGLKMEISYHGNGGDIKTAEVVIYHPKNGVDTFKKLKQLDERSAKAEDDPLARSILDKVLKNKPLTEDEKEFQNKLKVEWNKIEIEYGKLYGYDDASIKRHLDKLNGQTSH